MFIQFKWANVCSAHLYSFVVALFKADAHSHLCELYVLLCYYQVAVSWVAQSVWCLATGWTTGRTTFDPRQRRKDFYSSLCVQTGSGAHPASCTMGTGGTFPAVKAWPRRDADHSPPSSAEVENE
jgi:hypothetical protein